jgi:hypothetical protein
MEVWADEMAPDFYYKRAGDPTGVYFTLHPWSREALLRRMRSKKDGMTGRDFFWMAKLKAEPEMVPARMHSRYIDCEGERQEGYSVVFLNPTMELKRVRRPPPYQDGFPCWCCVGKGKNERHGSNRHG